MLYAKYYNTTIENSPATKRIRDNASTNVHYIKRDKKTIVSIDSILSIIYESSKTSLEEGPIVYIFEDGDSLNINSSNALLKFVEEPKDNVYIVFLVENLSNIIDTIKSRCEILPFKPLNKTRIKDNLDNKGYDPILTKVLVEYTQDEEEIINIINDIELINIYNFITIAKELVNLC